MNTHFQTDGREPEVPSLKDSLLDIHEQCLLAQLSVIRRLRGAAASGAGARSGSGARLTEAPPKSRRLKGRSQVDLAEDILKLAATPLHISTIIAQIALSSGRVVDAESLVSALSKRIARNDRFRRTARNTFALL